MIKSRTICSTDGETRKKSVGKRTFGRPILDITVIQKNCLEELECEGAQVDSNSREQSPVTRFCEQGENPSACIKAGNSSSVEQPTPRN